jgi:hypothetical protein
MPWLYQQSTGNLTSPDGNMVGQGYSGHGPGVNDPTQQNVSMVGPIPQGEWSIGAFFDDPGGKGPIVSHLTPQPGTEVFGRSGFMIHGDNSEADHTASEGCIILARPLRTMISTSPDQDLVVVA